MDRLVLETHPSHVVHTLTSCRHVQHIGVHHGLVCFSSQHVKSKLRNKIDMLCNGWTGWRIDEVQRCKNTAPVAVTSSCLCFYSLPERIGVLFLINEAQSSFIHDSGAHRVFRFVAL